MSRTRILRQGHYEYAACTVVHCDAPPARFFAELPSSKAMLDRSWSADRTPGSWIERELRRGSVEMQERVERALARAPAEEAKIVGTHYGMLIACAYQPSLAPWLARLLAGETGASAAARDAIARELTIHALVSPELRDVFVSTGRSSLLPDPEPVVGDESVFGTATTEEASAAPRGADLASMEFDTETDVHPNGYDARLYALGRLVEPALDDVMFEEIPPSDGVPSPPQLPEHYLLHAYCRGARCRVVCGDTSDWLDVPAMLGMLNVILRDRGDARRFLALETMDQVARIVAGPMEALDRAIGDGRLRPGPADEAASIGKRWEWLATRALRPERPQLEAAAHAVQGIDDAREAWAKLAAAGLIGTDDVDHPGRRFVGDGLDAEQWPPLLAHPPDVAACVALAADWKGVQEAERIVRLAGGAEELSWRIASREELVRGLAPTEAWRVERALLGAEAALELLRTGYAFEFQRVGHDWDFGLVAPALE